LLCLPVASHGVDYIIRRAKPMIEHYFASRVFRHLRFGDVLE
jgi:hypothetical protein